MKLALFCTKKYQKKKKNPKKPLKCDNPFLYQFFVLKKESLLFWKADFPTHFSSTSLCTTEEPLVYILMDWTELN